MEVSDRYQLHRSVVYVKTVVVSPEAGRRVQVDSADGASIERPQPLSPSSAAVSAVASGGMQLRPMANKGLVYNWWGCRLYVGARGGVGGGYLHQQLLAEVQHARLLVVVDAPELVGVSNAHIE